MSGSQLKQEVAHLADSFLDWLYDNKLVPQLCWEAAMQWALGSGPARRLLAVHSS